MAKRFNKYYQAIQKLRKECPAFHEVEVRRTTVPKPLFGDCGFDEERGIFKIRILKNLSETAAIETLVHEWAHALVWFCAAACLQEGDHHSEWGVAYARCYRALYED